MFPQLPNRTACVNADPNLPCANQLGSMAVQGVEGHTLKLLVALLESAAPGNNQTMLVDHTLTPDNICPISLVDSWTKCPDVQPFPGDGCNTVRQTQSRCKST
jgi:hypothetical protein